jgi:hypothetical protein
MLKFLGIAVTALSLTACLLLIALWVRSYRYNDILEKKTSSRLLQLHSRTGCLTFRQSHPGRNPRIRASDLALILDEISLGRTFISDPVSDSSEYPWGGGVFGFGRFEQGSTTVVFAPHWFPVLLSGTLAVIPWFPWSRRFSLRTLLIVTTLVAVALGIVAVSQ